MKEDNRSEIKKTTRSVTIVAKELEMQNNKFLRFTKDLNAQLYTLCNLIAAEVKYIEKTIIDMDASRSRRKSE